MDAFPRGGSARRLGLRAMAERVGGCGRALADDTVGWGIRGWIVVWAGGRLVASGS